MKRVLVAVMGLSTLACMGAGSDERSTDPPEAPEVVEDEAEAPTAGLPPVEADEDERLDDCMPESYEDATRVLKAEQPSGGAPEVDASPNRIVETVVMENGMTVRVQRGGCAHAGETWWVAPASGKAPPVKRMQRVLKRLALDEEATLGIRYCLKDAPTPLTEMWSAGDATCSFEQDGDVMSFTYDFAI